MKKTIVVLIVLCSFVLTTRVCASFAVVNSENGDLLLGQDAHQPLPVASLTKIWTAYVVLQNSSLNEQVTVSQLAAHMEGSSIYLEEGQIESVETLLYGLLLRSGNDAATALAEHVGGSVEGFVYLMNEEARRAGLANSHFENPSGLHDDQHLLSAYDMAQMLNIAMHNKEFRQIASSTYYTNSVVHWQNKHRLIGEGAALAGKTGYTKVAGRTLATFFKYKDRSFTVVTLNESNDWELHRQLAEQIVNKFEKRQVVKAGLYNLAGRQFIIEQPIEVLLQKDAKIEQRIKLSRLNTSEALWFIIQNDETIAVRRVTTK